MVVLPTPPLPVNNRTRGGSTPLARCSHGPRREQAVTHRPQAAERQPDGGHERAERQRGERVERRGADGDDDLDAERAQQVALHRRRRRAGQEEQAADAHRVVA